MMRLRSTPGCCLRRVGWLGALLLALASSLVAQQALYVQNGDKFEWVRDVHNGLPQVLKKGELETIYGGTRFAFQKASEFEPYFVSIRDINVTYASAELINNGAEINKNFEFSGDFESAYHLEHAFVALDIVTEDKEKFIFVQEIGELLPNRSNHISIVAPIQVHLGKCRYTVHVFVKGYEVLTSNIPFAAREAILNRMVASSLHGVVNQAPKPFLGPDPEYPKSLAKTHPAGTAKVTFRIGRNGAVLDPKVKSASDPAFGESALAAIRLWRFLPKVEYGMALTTKAEMPFVFEAANGK